MLAVNVVILGLVNTADGVVATAAALWQAGAQAAGPLHRWSTVACTQKADLEAIKDGATYMSRTATALLEAVEVAGCGTSE
jgi:hypothetical protein